MDVLAIIRQRVEDARRREEQMRIAAEKAIPAEYRDFLVFIEENEPILNGEPELKKGEKLPPGVFTWKGRTYVKVKAPYMVVAGRVKWFTDDHKKAGAKYSVTTNITEIKEMLANGQPVPPNFPLITRVESELYGTAEGFATIQFSERGANATHPLENAETSSLGRALAKLGYGLIGPGLASAEEIEEARRREAAKEEGEVVEVSSQPPREFPTSKGTYVGYVLKDRRVLLIPKGATPEVKPGSLLRVVGVEKPLKGGSVALWAKVWEVA